MFDKDELKIISRALTSHYNQLMKAKETIEQDYLPGDEKILEDIIERIVNVANVDEKVQEELWQMMHGKEVE